MSDRTIRLATPADEPQWAALWTAYNEFYQRTVDARATRRTWSALARNTGQPHGFVAELGGRLVGFTHYFFVPSTSDWTPRCYLQDLFADPDARGRGIGRALIEAVYADADDKNAAQVYWLTDQNNTSARQLYDRVASATPFIKYKR